MLSDRKPVGVLQSMIKHNESHLDHNLTDAQIAFILERFADRQAFFIDTIELPAELGTVPCGLHGPIVGGAPVAEADVTYAKRGTRTWDSRLVDRPPVASHVVTVIAGPHEENCTDCAGSGSRQSLAIPYAGGASFYTCATCKGAGKIKHACIIYTCYGGPLAPQEPGDPGCRDVEASRVFWAEHALAR